MADRHLHFRFDRSGQEAGGTFVVSPPIAPAGSVAPVSAMPTRPAARGPGWLAVLVLGSLPALIGLAGSAISGREASPCTSQHNKMPDPPRVRTVGCASYCWPSAWWSPSPSRSSGAQPWHLDPGLTAVGFTTGHLGFAELNQETSRRVVGREAWIGVGRDRHDRHLGTAAGMDPTRMGTAAVVHLARIGAGGGAAWEVVGTRDSTPSITAPRYGAAVSSPLTVGGRISGVDEALRVAVIDGNGRTLGRVSGAPAGGGNTPWSVTVGFARPSGGVLTVVVSTGGHVAEVERFAVTGVRTGGSG